MKQVENKILYRFRKHLCWLLGAACCLFMLIPYLILGTDSIVTYHDQLDGEMIAYILQARHLFQGDILPEFMGGMDKTALTMPRLCAYSCFCRDTILPLMWPCSYLAV